MGQMVVVRELREATAPRGGNGHRPCVSLEDFCREPRRSAVLARFPRFPRVEVEDAFSFAVEKGVQNLCREESEASIGAWLHKVMRHRLMRVMARHQVVQSGGGNELDAFASPRPTPEQEALRAERCREIASFVDSLPERTAQVLRGRYFEEMSRGQVAASLGLSEKQVKRDLEGAMDALEGFVADRAGSEPCEFGRKAVTVNARGWARGAVADQARRHLTKCEQCRRFHADFRAMRWGAAAAVPLPLVAADALDQARVVEKATAAADWIKQQLGSVAARTDPTPLTGIRGGGAAALAATCLKVGGGGVAAVGVAYCALNGPGEVVRQVLPGGSSDAAEDKPDQSPEPSTPDAVAPPVATAPPPAAPDAAPESAAPPEPPPPEPQPEEFTFERTVPTDSASGTAGATASASPSPSQPAPAPESGGGEFAP